MEDHGVLFESLPVSLLYDAQSCYLVVALASHCEIHKGSTRENRGFLGRV